MLHPRRRSSLSAPRVRLLLLALLLPLALGAQAPPEGTAAPQAGPAATFRGSADVRVVEVPVQVVRDGQPVRGLGRDDFSVWIGKKKQPLLDFEVVDLSVLAPTSESAPAAPVSLPAAGRRHVLLLFDLSHSDPAALVRAQDAALDVVRNALTAADLIAVASYSPARGAKVLLAFTSDRKQVELALTTLGSTELVEHRTDWLGLYMGEAKERVVNGGLLGGISANNKPSISDARLMAAEAAMRRMADLNAAEQRSHTETETQQAKDFTRGLQDLAELMQRVDGRKRVVLLSTGFDSSLLLGSQREAERMPDTNEEGVGAVWRTDSDARYGATRLQGALGKTVEAMRRGDCIIDAIDIGHLATGEREISSDVADIAGTRTERGATRAGEDSLFALAQGTGGTLYRNFNDIGAAMRKVLDASALTYLLTIALPADIDGYVPLRVDVRGTKPGEVHARAGFQATPTEGQQAAMAERLRIGAEVLEGRAGGSIAAAVLGVPAGVGGGPCAVVEVDGPSLLGNTLESVVSGEVTLYAFAADGTIAAVARQLVGLDLRVVGDKLRRGGFQLFAPLDLPPGRYELRALVRNTIGNRYGIATGVLVVPAASAAPPTLAAVFSQPAGREWLLVRNDDGSGRAPIYPFVVGERTVTPAVAPRLHAGEPGTLWLRAGTATGLRAEVRRADGTSAGDAPVTIVDRQPIPGAGEALLAKVAPASLPAGDYTLEVRTATGLVALPFTID